MALWASCALLACCVLGCASSRAGALSENDPRIRALLHGADVGEQTRAMEELAHIGPAAVPPLAKMLASPAVDDFQGAWIAETLGRIGPSAEPAARALASRLARGGECSPTTSWALGTMGPAGVPWLVKALRTGEPKGRLWASHSLRYFGAADSDAVAALIAALHDDVADVRAEAAWTLGYMKLRTPSVEAALRKALQDGNKRVRYAASEALEGPEIAALRMADESESDASEALERPEGDE